MTIARIGEEKEPLKSIAIVGGGPIGLAFAWGLKKLHPELKVVVHEKHSEYQRSHTLIMQSEPLKALMAATQTENETILSELHTRLKADQHIRTNELEQKFKSMAEGSGVELRTGVKVGEITPENFQERILDTSPCLIIGADGTHSTVNSLLFPKNNQVKLAFDYVLQLRYEINGSERAQRLDNVAFYKRMAEHGMIASEYVGAYDVSKQTTPVTMQMMIAKDAYEKLHKIATSKNPIYLYPADEKNKEEQPEIKFEYVPEKIRSFLDSYLAAKIRESKETEGEQKLDRATLRCSVNEAPATYAQQPAIIPDDKPPALLVGDAGLGLSYFKGLNAGIEAAAKFFTYWTAIIKDEASITTENLSKVMAAYTAWFTKDFAPRKVQEVEDYSTLNIRFPEKIMRFISKGQEDSCYADPEATDRGIIDAYFHSVAYHSSHSRPKEALSNLGFYPHRDYDPDTVSGLLSSLPLKHSLIKIRKLFVDFVKPYKSQFQFFDNFKQPFVGLASLFNGMVKIIEGFFKRKLYYVIGGILSLIKGALELATTPLAWFLKPLTRGVATAIHGLVWGRVKIEDNAGMQRLAALGLKKVEPVESQLDAIALSEMSRFSVGTVNLGVEELPEQKQKWQAPYSEERYKLFALANDLHRKFYKSLNRGQSSECGPKEPELYFKILDQRQPFNAQHFEDYFSLFARKKGGRKLDVEENTGTPHSAVTPSP